MKFKSILTVALAALVLAGCAKNESGTDNPQELNEGAKTTVTIKLNQTSQNPVLSRAVVDETAEGAEKTISSGFIYAFTQEGVLESVTSFDDGDLSGGTLDIECGVGQRRFYALINPPADFTPPSSLTAPATTIYDFEKYVYEVSDIADLTDATNGFFMTNLERPVLETMVAETTNNVTISVGRATAKLNVAYVADTKTNGEPNGTLRSVVYKLKSTPKEIYLNSFYETNIFKTPKYGVAYDAANFLISPSSATTAYVDAVDDKDNCFYMTEAAAPATMITRGPLNYVVIRGTYTPKENYVDKDGNPLTAPTQAVTFFRKVEVDGSGKFVKFLDEKCYKEAPDTYPATVVYQEYTDGVCYYPFLIRGSGTDKNDPASYNVVRNYLYKAQIVVVNGPGWWSEDATDPNGENVGGETQMQIDFAVEDWTPGVNQEGGI